MMRFDAYVATVEDVDAHQMAEDVQRVIEDSLGGQACRWELSSAKLGYQHAVQLMDDSDQKKRRVHALLRYGGNGGTCNVEAKGEPSADLAAWIRGAHPTHRLARGDVANDVTGAGLYDRITAQLLALCDEFRLAVDQRGDWHRGNKPRSLYIGAPSSDVRLVWYEKGKQLIGEGLSGADPNHCRLELRLRPAKQAKTTMASMPHLDMWGATAWTRRALALVSGIDVDAFSMRVWRQPDHERALHYMLKYYGPTLLREVEIRGSWEAFGRQAVAQIDSITNPVSTTRKAA